MYIIAVLDCDSEKKDAPETKGDGVKEEQDVMPTGKGHIFYVFSCTAGGRTLDSSKLSNCIEELTIAQVKKSKGVFNSLDGRSLRYHLN